MNQVTIEQILQELNVTTLDDALNAIIKLKLGYQPWRDRRGELLSQPTLSDAEKHELKDIEAKLMPIGWRASFGRSHEDAQAMKIIRKTAKLLEAQNEPIA